MKTVWHWKEIAKGFALWLFSTVLVVAVCGFFKVPEVLSFFAGFVVSVGTLNYAFVKWDMYHFK